MTKQIILDGKPYEFTQNNLPCLIHGIEHSGASLFTVTMTAQLFKHGFKILFLSGYPMAREEFVRQTDDKQVTTFDSSSDISFLEDKEVIFLLKENANLLIRLVNELEDVEKRIIVVKNVELFDKKIYEALTHFSNIIISGNIEKTDYKDMILTKQFHSSIFFTPSPQVTLPTLPRYSGYLQSAERQGVISLKEF